MDLLQVMLKSICVVSMIVVIYGVPIENQTTAILHDGSESQTLNTRHNRVTGNSDQSKNIHIRHGKLLPNVTSLKLRGYSSMRMLSKAEIEHPNFDPLEYMKTTGTEPIQNIEIQPDIKMPYFTFGSSNLIQTSTNNDGKSRRRRIKRHHPTTSLRSVVGELQNFALVPIKSNNGQIRYILLKNPKFVIGNPSQTGKVAPSIVQLNNNRLTTSSNNQIRYTPVPILPVTKPPYRKSTRRQSPKVPVATSIDSIFSRGLQESFETSATESKTSSKTSKTSIERIVPNKKPVPAPFDTFSSSADDILAAANTDFSSGLKLPKANVELAKNLEDNSLVSIDPMNVSRKPIQTLPSFRPFTTKPWLKTTVPNETSKFKTDQMLVNMNKADVPIVKANVTSGIKDAVNNMNLGAILSKAQTLGAEQLSGIGDINGIHLKVRNNSVSGEKITSNAKKQTITDSDKNISKAQSELTNVEQNSTNVDHKNISNIKLVKDGSKHKIVHTEMVETQVNIAKNLSEAKIDKANSNVVKSDPGHHIGIDSNVRGVESASIKTAETDKAKAAKQANVVKKTKKTTTITLKSPNETKTGKAEIAEIQHTVEEVVHHNTSETAAAEIAASSNVSISSPDIRNGINGNHETGLKETENAATSKHVGSTSKAFTKKSERKTIISKKPNNGDIPGSAKNNADIMSGLPSDNNNVQVIEHITNESSHSSKHTSNKSISANTGGQPSQVQPAISVQRHPRPVPHASPIDAMFSSPTKSSPIIANSHPQYRTDPKPQTHFSAPDIHVQPLHTHDHGSHGSHGSHGNNVVTPSKGDTVQKTEVVETVIETKSAETAAAKQDTAQASSAAAGSQVVATGNGVVGDAGITSVDTAASSSQSAAASSSSAAKEEKVVKKTKKTTTTVVKAGSDPMAPSGGGAVEQIQVVEETVHAGSSSSVAAASEAAAVSAASSASSATSSNGGSTSGGNGVAEVAVASASNAASSASAAESNSTTTVKKKVVKKTTTITKSTDTSGLAGMNSEIPRAILSDISTKPKFATTKKPPTAILSDSSNKKSTINTKAVLIATDRPKLVAPKISIASTTVPTVSMGTSTSRPMSTEEGEVEPEERTTTLATNTVATSARDNSAPKTNTNVSKVTKATNPVNTTSAPSAQPAVHKFDLGSGYEIFFDGRFISFKPITSGQAKGKPGAATKSGQSALGMLLSGQGGSLELTLNNQTKTLGGMPAQGSHKVSGWAGGPTTEPPLGPNDRMNTTDVPEEIEARPDKRAYMPMQNYNLPLGYISPRERPLPYSSVTAMPGLPAVSGVAGWAQSPTTTEPALGANDRINTTDVPEEIEARPDKTRAQRRALLRRMNPGFTNAQIEAQLIRDDKARAKMAATQSEPVVLLPEAVTPPTPPPPRAKLNAKKPSPGVKPRKVFRARRKKKQNKVVPKRRPRPRPRTTTTPEPTYPPTYPTTTQYYPTTYPTPANYQYNGGPQNNQYQQQQFQPAQQYQPPPRRQQQFQPAQQQYQPTGPPPQQQQQQRPVRPRRRQQRRNRRPQGRPIGRRQERLRTTTDREEIPARDRIARWFLNNIDTEVLDTFLPLFAMG